MKKQIMWLLYCLFPFVLVAQDEEITKKVKVREVGISMSNLNSFGLVYRAGGAFDVFRINVLSGYVGERGGDIFGNSGVITSNVGVGIGLETRNEIADKLEVRYGLEIMGNRSTIKFPSESKNYSRQNLLAFGFIMGINYKVNDYIVIGAEIIPQMGMTSDKKVVNHQETVESGKFIGFSNQSALLTIVYRISKAK